MVDDVGQGIDGNALRQARDMAMETRPIALDAIVGPDGDMVPIGVRYEGQANGYKPIDLKTEFDRWRTKPERRAGVANAETLESFCDLVNRHKDGSSALFANIGDLSNPKMVAVIDYHTVERTARFGKHRIVYAWPVSREWRAWMKISGQAMAQDEFASFLEDHVHEIAETTPDERADYDALLGLKFGSAADVMRVARGFSLMATIGVKAALTLPTGEASIAFEEAHDTNGYDGKPVKVPSILMLSLPLFEGGGPVRVAVRLRYKRRGAGVEWTFLLFRADDVVRAALRRDADGAEHMTGLPLYFGSPES